MTEDEFAERLGILMSVAMDGDGMSAGRVAKALEQAVAFLGREIADMGGSPFSRGLAGLCSDAIDGAGWRPERVAELLRQRMADLREAEAA